MSCPGERPDSHSGVVGVPNLYPLREKQEGQSGLSLGIIQSPVEKTFPQGSARQDDRSQPLENEN
jgi:hypothetical protein